MDRTYEITQLALRHRSASSIHHNRFCASPEIATTEKQFITEAISLNERLVECERKVKTAEMIVKNSSLFDSKHYQLQTITDSVDDEVRVIKRKWEELETGSWLLAAGIKDILQGKLSAVMKEFKSVLQVRSDTLHLLETRKGHLSLQTSSQVASLLQLQDEIASQQLHTAGLEQAERQLVELSSLFQEIGRMVYEHELQLTRIDMHTEEALGHVETAKKEISVYYEGVTSNRNLTVKVFMIFVVFFAFFVVFLV